MTTLTTVPLVEPIDPAAYARFWPARPGYPDHMTGRATLLRVLWLPIIMAAAFLAMGVTWGITAITGVEMPSIVQFLIWTALSFLGIPTIGAYRDWLDAKMHRLYRLDRFAAANDLGYSHTATMEFRSNPALGLIFSIPDATTTKIEHVLGGRSPVPFRAGYCDVELPAGSRGETAHWTFLEIILDRELPHIVLDSIANGSSGLPARFSGAKELQLEGDFHRSFRTYALTPKAADALYVLAPDVMAQLIDNAGQADVEIVGNRIYFYFPRRIDVLDPAWWEWVEGTVATIGAPLRRTSGRSTFTPSEVRRDGIRYRNRRVRRALRIGGAVLLAIAAAVVAYSVLVP